MNDLLDRFLVWWRGSRLRGLQRRRAAATPAALRFPFRLGSPISEVRAAIHREYGDDAALDQPLPARSSRSDRLRSYVLGNPGGASVNVAYAYREIDEIVWSIRVDNAAPSFTGQLGEVSLTADAASIARVLGPPAEEVQAAPLLSALSWKLPDCGYRIEVYRETYDDIGGYHRAGEISSIEWFSRSLAPEDYAP